MILRATRTNFTCSRTRVRFESQFPGHLGFPLTQMRQVAGRDVGLITV